MVGFLENKYAFFLVNVQKSENIYIMANKSIYKENVFFTKIRQKNVRYIIKQYYQKVCYNFFPGCFSEMCQSKNVKPYILYECILSLSCIWHIFLYIMWMPYTQKSYSNEGFYICLAIYALSHVKKRLFGFWIFLINKKVLRMYDAYFLFNLT